MSTMTQPLHLRGGFLLDALHLTLVLQLQPEPGLVRYQSPLSLRCGESRPEYV